VIDRDTLYRAFELNLNYPDPNTGKPQCKHPGNFLRWMDPVHGLGYTLKDEIRNTEYENIWVWSDPHFNHTNIIRHTNRPFSCSREMDDALIENYKRVVGANDLVICVGDLALSLPYDMECTICDLPGTRVLVFGNHDIDRHKRTVATMWDNKGLFHQILPILVMDDIIFSHHPWFHHYIPGYNNVSGHIHNHKNLSGNFNASVDVCNFSPVRIDIVKEYFKD
jgi:calcineurin-like phosphoesterase family protein